MLYLPCVMNSRIKRRKDIACYEKLKYILLSGELSPGTRLGEIEWSKRLEGNPAALREAMTRLADQGLLRRGEKGGYFVPDYDPSEMAEIYEVRAILGVGAIRLIGRKTLSEEQLQPLGEICDTMDRLLDAKLLMGYREADRKFHDTLILLSGNKRLQQTYQNVLLPVIHYDPTDPELRMKLAREGVKTHREIYRLLVRGQYEKAAKRLQDHIEVHVPSDAPKEETEEAEAVL